jgi:protein-tyrosine kinase
MGRLAPEDVARINEVMRIAGVGFGDAAIRLGLITAEEIEDAIRAAREPPPTSADGVMEQALEIKRNLPVKYVRTVVPGPSLILAHHPDNSYSEQIRALRTELLLLNNNRQGGAVIGILSPCRSEGRTQLCAELAIAFSQLGQRTLLIDADLRHPRIHALFESHNTHGLGQALASGADSEILGVHDLPYLSLLIAGPSVPNPLELLTNGDFEMRLSALQNKYSVIIVDTPPITEYADGLAIASFAAQVVIVGRSGSTPHKNMKEMLRRMGRTQSRIVGAVINTF